MFGASVTEIRGAIHQLIQEALALGREINRIKPPGKNKKAPQQKKDVGVIVHEDPLTRAICHFAKRQAQAPEARVNLDREGVLALGLLPPKRWLRINGNVKFRRNPTHLAIVHRYLKWKLKFTATNGREPTHGEADTILRDFSPMIEDLMRLSQPKAGLPEQLPSRSGSAGAIPPHPR
jgi:hypothetical protein